jgi:hypothetical protein
MGAEEKIKQLKDAGTTANKKMSPSSIQDLKKIRDMKLNKKIPKFGEDDINEVEQYIEDFGDAVREDEQNESLSKIKQMLLKDKIKNDPELKELLNDYMKTLEGN